MPRKKGSGGITWFSTVPPSVDVALRELAVSIANETGRVVPEPELRARACAAGVAAMRRCAGCRAGTCQRHRIAAATLPTIEPAPPEVPAPPPVPVPVLALVPVEPEAPVPKRRGRPPGSVVKPRVITPESAEHTRLVDVYHKEFIRVRNEKPAYTSRDFAAFRALLETHGFDRASELIRNAFADSWWAPRVTIRRIADDPSVFVGDAQSSARPSTMQREPMPEGWQ